MPGARPAQTGPAHPPGALQTPRHCPGHRLPAPAQPATGPDCPAGPGRLAAALLDRLLHHAIVVEIEGHSYRLREHANLVPDSLKGQLLDRVEKPKRKPGRPRQRSAAQSD